MKSKNKIKSILSTKLFLVPSIIWLLLSLLAMTPDQTDPDPLTWSELITVDIALILLWFMISWIVITIMNHFKNKSKVINHSEIQTATKNNPNLSMQQEDVLKKAKKKNHQYLYACDGTVDAYEYKKMAKYFPKRTYWVFIMRGILINLVATAFVAIFTKSWIETLVFFIVYQLYVFIYCKIRLESIAEKVFNHRQKRGEIESNVEIEFYEDNLIRRGENLSLTIPYTEISRCIENDTNFYLEYPTRNMIIIIQKNRCDLELISFIRSKFQDLENHLGDSSHFTGVKKYQNPTFIKTGMLILFIVTIVSLWGALATLALVNQIHPQHGFNFIKNTWVFWCWLPIPILSIILGFKYKKAGFLCTKNIVAGFIIGFLLFVYGSFCLHPAFSRDYSEIDTYREIIDAKLPNEGELEIQNWGTYFDQDKTEYTIINAYYDQIDVKELENSIENSNHWILSTNIKSELKILIPSQLFSDSDAYYSIYNNTLKQYNTLPDITGNYEIYAMKYDKSQKQLEIHKFKYSYIK